MKKKHLKSYDKKVSCFVTDEPYEVDYAGNMVTREVNMGMETKYDLAFSAKKMVIKQLVKTQTVTFTNF